jgi:hypothetical protein
MWIGHGWSQCCKGTPAKSNQYALRHRPNERDGLLLSTTRLRLFQPELARLTGDVWADARSPHEFRIDYLQVDLVQVCEPPALAREH